MKTLVGADEICRTEEEGPKLLDARADLGRVIKTSSPYFMNSYCGKQSAVVYELTMVKRHLPSTCLVLI